MIIYRIYVNTERSRDEEKTSMLSDAGDEMGIKLRLRLVVFFNLACSSIAMLEAGALV